MRRLGPSFDSLHSWSKYLNVMVYNHGVPREPRSYNFVYDNGRKVSYEGYYYKPPAIKRWEKSKNELDRSSRFPSVEERIRYYMGSWYDIEPNGKLFNEVDESCMNNSKAEEELSLDFFHAILVNPFNLSPKKLYNVAFEEKPKHVNKSKDFFIRRNAQYYTRDIIDLAILHRNSSTPVLLYFGDGASHLSSCFNTSFPVFSKVRDLVAETDARNCRFYSKSGNCRSKHTNIIWPLNRGRHFRPASRVPISDCPWDKKINKLIWRGRALCDEERSLRNLHSVDVFSCDQS